MPPADRLRSARGYIYVASAALLWAISATLGRAAFTGRFGPRLHEIDPLILSQSRVTLSFFVLFPVLWWRRGSHGIRVPLADFGRLAALGVFGVAVSNYFYYVAVQRTNVATAIIVQYTAPVWVLLYMVGRRFQRATPQRVGAVLLALGGVALAVGLVRSGAFRPDLYGVIAALLAALSFATYNIGTHRLLHRYDHWLVIMYITLAAALLWLLINPPWKLMAAHYSREEWLFLIIFAILSVLGPFSLYIAGLRYLDPTRAIIVSCLEPVVSVVIAAVALGESVSLGRAAGMLLVLAAIVLIQMPDPKSSDHTTVLQPIE